VDAPVGIDVGGVGLRPEVGTFEQAFEERRDVADGDD